MRLAVLLLAACASARSKPDPIDWVAIDAAIRQARWRTDHCVEPNSEKCDALWLVREELEAVIEATREAFQKTHQAELERLAP